MSKASVTLKPAKPGLLVRDPLTRIPLAAEGTRVNLSTFWRRRLAAGEVVEVAPPKLPTAPEPAEE